MKPCFTERGQWHAGLWATGFLPEKGRCVEQRQGEWMNSSSAAFTVGSSALEEWEAWTLGATDNKKKGEGPRSLFQKSRQGKIEALRSGQYGLSFLRAITRWNLPSTSKTASYNRRAAGQRTEGWVQSMSDMHMYGNITASDMDLYNSFVLNVILKKQQRGR